MVHAGLLGCCCVHTSAANRAIPTALRLETPSSCAEPDGAQEKLRLDVDDEGASEWMQQLIHESVTALMPQIMETTHRFAQYWR